MFINNTPLDQFATHRKLMRCKALWLEKIICQSNPNTPFNGNTPWLFEDIFNSCIITITFTEVNLTHFRSILTTQPKSAINLLIRAYIPVTHASLSKLFVPSARIAQGTMLSCTRVCPQLGFFSYSFARHHFRATSFDFVSRADMKYMATFCCDRSKCSHIARLFNDVGKFSI